MRPSAFIGALVGAALGALLWAGVASMTGLEIGWIAWIVGGAVGFGAAVLGGQGASTGAVCAVLALLSIFAGKWLGIDMIAESEIRKATALFATMDVYEEIRVDAAAFGEVISEDEHADYMVERGYTEARYPEDVTALELAAFRQEVVPELRKFQSQRPSFPVWKQQIGDEAVRFWEATGSNYELVKENLGFLDVIFGFLGVITAFQVGARGLGGAGGADVISRGARAPAHRSHGSATDPYPSRDAATQASTARINQDEPPNPYAYPGPGSQSEPSAPAEPFRPRKIARLSQEPAGTSPDAPQP